jgi:hypothetical protein
MEAKSYSIFHPKLWTKKHGWYCHICEMKLIEDILEGYDTRTGEANYYLKCPSGLCLHAGIDHKWRRKDGWFPGYYDIYCEKCGGEGHEWSPDE